MFGVGAGARGGGLVKHLAVKDVGLGDLVGGGEVLALTGRQGSYCPLVAGELVADLNVGYGQDPVVGDGDLVADDLAQGVGLAVGGGAGGDLGHGKVAVLGVCGFGVLARYHRGLGFVGVGAGALGGGHVQDLALKDVGLGDLVAGGEVLAGAGGQGSYCPLIAGERIAYRNVGEGEVAVVGDGYPVGDLLAQGVGPAVGGGAGGRLGHGDVAVLGIRGFGVLTGDHCGFGFVGVGAGALGGGHVEDLALKDVRLGHLVGGGEVFALLRRQGSYCPLIACELIGYGNVGDRQVAVVGDGYLVGDLLAQRVSLAVGGGSGGCLGNGEVSVLVFREFGVLAGHYRRCGVAALGGGHVQHLAVKDVGLGDLVSRGEVLALSGGQGIYRPLVSGEVVRYDNIGQ